MANEKYGKYIRELVFLPWEGAPNGPRKRALMCDARILPAATHEVEIFLIHQDGTDYSRTGPELKPSEEQIEAFLDPDDDISILRDFFKVGPHYHMRDENFLFIGTNPDDPMDLGGEVEFWLGLGRLAEKHTISKPSYVFIPAGLVHAPLVFKNVRRPFHEVIFKDGPRFQSVEIGAETWPPDFTL